MTDFAYNYERGWVCPKCGRVYSPSNPSCASCNSHISDCPVYYEPLRAYPMTVKVKGVKKGIPTDYDD